MKINSELPLCMLDENLRINDYDFVLYHLYAQNTQYKEYFNKLRETHPDRLMIFDNSAYEFFVKGETLNMDNYISSIIELKPDYFIIPDKLMDMNETLKLCGDFMNRMFGNYMYLSMDDLSINNSKPMAVAQGNTPEELFNCINKFMLYGLSAIAIPFHNSFFKTMQIDDDIKEEFINEYGVLNEDHFYAMGRIQWVRENENILYWIKHVHFLGSHCPLEKKFYKQFTSMDTGYPVKCAIEGHELFKEPNKPNIIIDDFFDKPLSDSTKILIETNVSIFKNI